jgi:hypothetical protein
MELKSRKKHKRRKIWFGIIGLIVIPLYSFLLSQNGPGGDLILVTFSQIGSRYGAIEDLIIWGIISSFYYFIFLEYLFYLSESKSKFLRITLAFSCLSLLITVFLPFAPAMFPIASETHNTLAYITAISIVLTLFLYVFEFWKRDRKLFYLSFFLLLFIVTTIIMVLIFYGVSSLFQIVLSSSLCLFLFLQLCFLEKSKKIDIFKVFEKEEQKEQNQDLF